jgi:hypothetical protein
VYLGMVGCIPQVVKEHWWRAADSSWHGLIAEQSQEVYDAKGSLLKKLNAMSRQV